MTVRLLTGHSGDPLTEEEKEMLDCVHLAKIDASHAIVVINPGGYIGESTKREIAHAEASRKRVYYTDYTRGTTRCGGRTVYQLRVGPGDWAGSLRDRAFDHDRAAPADVGPAPTELHSPKPEGE